MQPSRGEASRVLFIVFMVEIKSDSLWVLSREKNAPKMASEPVLLLVIGLDCAEDTETLVLIVTGVL